MDLGITDHVFVVSGGSTGLGFATARVLVDEGARVVVVARDEACLDVRRVVPHRLLDVGREHARLLVREGSVVVRVADGVIVEVPIHIVAVDVPDGTGTATCTGVVLELGAGSAATVVESRLGASDLFGGSNIRTTITLGEIGADAQDHAASPRARSIRRRISSMAGPSPRKIASPTRKCPMFSSMICGRAATGWPDGTGTRIVMALPLHNPEVAA